ncbi:DUF4148 domain-containing protein [Azohydromonas aeria]|uniref:DUF4148 domain-containing protein n=1 Tax=Azohydromonas aeria TaxID=2590212 RepID=UPI0012FADD2B|nr:DUF4148 domain-containing protein [Azohydromonas aeria]
MKATLVTTVLAAACAALLSFNSQAADLSSVLRESAPPSFADAVPGKTRAQVKAELAEAVARGEVSHGGVPPAASANYTVHESAPAPLAGLPTGKTRAQVKAELAEAIARGEVFVGAGNAYRRGYESAPFEPAPYSGAQGVARR